MHKIFAKYVYSLNKTRNDNSIKLHNHFLTLYSEVLTVKINFKTGVLLRYVKVNEKHYGVVQRDLFINNKLEKEYATTVFIKNLNHEIKYNLRHYFKENLNAYKLFWLINILDFMYNKKNSDENAIYDYLVQNFYVKHVSDERLTVTDNNISIVYETDAQNSYKYSYTIKNGFDIIKTVRNTQLMTLEQLIDALMSIELIVNGGQNHGKVE